MKALHGRAERDASRSCTRPRRYRCCRVMTASPGCGCAATGALSICAPRRSCWPAAGSRRMPRCARYLGPGWDLAKVRGSRYNVGQGHRMALEIGAAPAGHWSGAHACACDLDAPPVGDLDVGDRFQKHGYPFVLSSMRGASAFSTRVSISTPIPMPSTAAKSSSSPACSRGRCSTGRPSICCATNTASRARRRRGPTRWRRSPQSSKGSIRKAFSIRCGVQRGAAAGRAVQPQRP